MQGGESVGARLAWAAGYLLIWGAATAMRMRTGDGLDAIIMGVLFAGLLPPAIWLFTRKARPEPVAVARPGAETAAVLAWLAVYAVVVLGWLFTEIKTVFRPETRTYELVMLAVKLAVHVAAPILILKAMGARVGTLLAPRLGARGVRPLLLTIGVVVTALMLVVSPSLKEISAIEATPATFAWAVPASFLWLVLVAGFCEEFLFRAVVQSRLAAFLKSETGAVVIGALLFALAHAPGLYLRPARRRRLRRRGAVADRRDVRRPLGAHAQPGPAGPAARDRGLPAQSVGVHARLGVSAGAGRSMAGWTLGVIGGSGLYDLDGLTDRELLRVESPFGTPSSDVLAGRLGGVRLLFLPRHGPGHTIPPGDIDARANIDVLKRAGCTDLLSLSAVGSLREDLSPGTFVIVDQYVDRTVSRPASFFGPGLVAHVSLADPVCARLAGLAAAAAREAGVRVVEGGTYLAMEGPQFSTRAESRLYRSWGCDVIGMTNLPEARLAREAELPYASVCMVTDYDSWREGHAPVEVGEIIAQLAANAANARALVRRLAAALPADRIASPVDTALDGAIITPPDARDPAMVARLDAVAGRVLRC